MTAPSDEPASSAGTGNERVDAAIERLRGLDAAPVESHSAVYEAVHEELRAALTAASAEGRPGDHETQ